MKLGFSKNIDLLNETSQVDDLLDFSGSISDFEKFLDGTHRHSLVGLIGDFGSGKSTMLYQIEKKSEGEWIVFDAWSFPNRKDLWEGFVLDFARRISKRTFDNARKRIDGEKLDDARSLIKTISFGANLFYPGAGVLGNLSSLFRSSPARRIFEFREILADLVKSAGKDLFVVLEDIDRSGAEGAVFLEALKQFIESDIDDYTKHKVIFIVPMGSSSYKSELAESYNKSIDLVYTFKPRVGFIKFIDEVFDENLFISNGEYWQEHMIKLFQYFIKNRTIRDLKRVLRQANQNYLRLTRAGDFNPDPRMVVLMGIFHEYGGRITNASIRKSTRTYPVLSLPDNICELVCLAISDNKKVEAIRDYGLMKFPQVVFVQNNSASIPGKFVDGFDSVYRLQISDLYLQIN